MSFRTFLLGFGVAAGLALAAVGSFNLRVHSGSDDPTALAVVNGHGIGGARFEIAARKTGAITAKQRAELLSYLIDEELLVQHAVQLGLLDSHPRLRKMVVRREIDSMGEGAADIQPSDEELARFYHSHAALFTRPRLLRVEGLQTPGSCSTVAVKTHLSRATQQLGAGATLEEAAHVSGMQRVAGLPGTPVSEPILARSLGESVVRALRTLRSGQLAAFEEVGCYLIRVTEVDEAMLPPLDSVREQLLLQYRNERRENALRVLLLTRRSQTVVQLAQ